MEAAAEQAEAPATPKLRIDFDAAVEQPSPEEISRLVEQLDSPFRNDAEYATARLTNESH